ncbi:hypothetical protein [Paenibacillus contaminans]|uniref:Uncharacterized protein n=1 Tax=Paenibacillus contaminans TaxID=450362 RepID=A0A329MS65_9BACL|nr:hypothetical protein DQG23_14975 [Paenibacillus contaminans]
MPQRYQQLVKHCLNDFNGKTDNIDFDYQNFREFVEYMIQVIKQDISLR